MTTHATPRIRRLARVLRALVATSVVLGAAATAHAHGPDPALSGVFGHDQALRFAWRDGSVPPVAIRTAIVAAADDANATRASRAPRFTLDATGTNPIGYGAGATCGPNGIACFTRKAPKEFTMWLREHGRVFDWGVLRWCQMQAVPADGCYDAENIALDEFGHVAGLDHHVNFGNDTDYLDAVVQTFSRTRPRDGWNVHRYGRCDVARLQIQYDVPDASAKVSTCLDLATKLTLAASATTVPYQGTVTLTATLKVGTSTAYGKLSTNVLDGRIVTLQRRSVGVITWTTIGPMAPGPTSGTYRLTSTIIVDVEYRAVFDEPVDEGLDASTSPTVRVLRGSCSKACPMAAPGPVDGAAR